MNNRLDHILASYYSMATEQSTDDAQKALLRDMSKSPELAKEVISDVREALGMPNFPWKQKFEEYEVFEPKTEEEARDYAVQLLTPIIEFDR